MVKDAGPFALLVFLVVPPAFAEDFYVTQAGANSHDGKLGSEWSAAELNSAANWGTGEGKIGGGDTVYLTGSITSDLTVQGSGEGTSDRITLDGSGAALSGCVSSSGKSHWTARDFAWVPVSETRFFDLLNGDDITIDGVTAAGTSNQSSSDTLFRLRGGLSHLTIKNVTITNAGRNVVHGWVSSSYAANDGVVFDSWVVTTTADQWMGADGFPVERDLMYFTSIRNFIIQNSYFEYSWLGKQDAFCAPSKCFHYDMFQFGTPANGHQGATNITFRNNMLAANGSRLAPDDNIGQVIMNSHINEALDIYGNIIVNAGDATGWAMLYLAWSDSVTGPTVLRFYNNTLVQTGTTNDSTWDVLLNIGPTKTGDRAYVHNNLFYSAYSGQQRMIYHTGGGSFTHDYNIFNAVGGSQAFDNTTCSVYASAHEACNTDPGFLDYPQRDFRIDRTSPAYDAGMDVGAPFDLGLSTESTSFPNPVLTTRVVPWDIGAYEVVDTIRAPAAPTGLLVE